MSPWEHEHPSTEGPHLPPLSLHSLDEKLPRVPTFNILFHFSILKCLRVAWRVANPSHTTLVFPRPGDMCEESCTLRSYLWSLSLNVCWCLPQVWGNFPNCFVGLLFCVTFLPDHSGRFNSGLKIDFMYTSQYMA